MVFFGWGFVHTAHSICRTRQFDALYIFVAWIFFFLIRRQNWEIEDFFYILSECFHFFEYFCFPKCLCFSECFCFTKCSDFSKHFLFFKTLKFWFNFILMYFPRLKATESTRANKISVFISSGPFLFNFWFILLNFQNNSSTNSKNIQQFT